MAPTKKSPVPPYVSAFLSDPKEPKRQEILLANPEHNYTFGDDIGTGKFSVVKSVVCKKTGKEFAAKIIKFDEQTLMFAMREFDIMSSEKYCSKNVPELHETYIVRKYLIIIMTLYNGKTLLEYFAHKHSITEEDIAQTIRQLLETLESLHSNNIVHLDVRPTNIRMMKADLKVLDFNSARLLANKKAGSVVDVIGDTEFCAPEMLSFDRVQPPSDIWSVGVIMYILLTGTSPYYDENENNVSLKVQRANFTKVDNYDAVTSEAKGFIKECWKIAPESRLTATKALAHKWLSAEYQAQRKNSVIKCQDDISSTDARLLEEEEEEYVIASLVLKTFEEEEYDSPESEDEDEEEEE